MRSARVLFQVCVGLLILCGIAAAQGTTADIVGRVVDSSGAVLPGATVTVENTATGDRSEEHTSELQSH